jgi:hypothetical protein
MFEKKKIIQSDPYKKSTNKADSVRNIYWAEVISIEDDTDGGRIKVRIPGLDNQNPNENLPFAYPLLPKFLHIYPQVGEMVDILIEDVRFPNRGRYWIGSVISQPQKIAFDNIYTAKASRNIAITAPEEAPSKLPEAQGVFPQIKDIGIIGRVNTDLILSDNQIEMRVGKHEKDNVLTLNKRNPASIKLNFDTVTGGTGTRSSQLLIADKIAIISHDGIPKFKAAEIDQVERERIFNEGHPLGRGDVIVEALELLRRAIIEHIHGYPKLPADRSDIITDLEKVDFTQILQKNIVIN